MTIFVVNEVTKSSQPNVVSSYLAGTHMSTGSVIDVLREICNQQYNTANVYYQFTGRNPLSTTETKLLRSLSNNQTLNSYNHR